MTLGRRTSDISPIQAGIPQGSPISPTLFLFFNAPLIEDCAKSGLKVQVGGFVDDVHLIAYSTSTETNCRTLEKAHQICLRWAQKHGASFAPKKYELIHLTRSPKKFNMEARVDLGAHQVAPKAVLKVLGLWIDGKLRWGPHIKNVQAKMAAQTMALTKVTTSIWGATLNKARQVYTAVVRLAMTYGAVVWHLPKRLKIKGPGPAAKLTTLQNKCLRSITGAYKATNIQVLEAETGVIPLDIHLDQAVLRAKDTQRCKEVICQAKEKVRRKLRGKRERKSRPGDTPMRIKEAWAKDIMEKLRSHQSETNQQESQVESLCNKKGLMTKWAKKRWKERWEAYLNTVPSTKKTPAHNGELRRQRDKLHQRLRKAESSLAIQLRTEKVGFAAFLHARRVPGVISPACRCGWQKEDPKHVIIFCPDRAHHRRRLYEAAGTNRYERMMSTGKGLRAVTRWVMSKSLLGQFSLAKEQNDWVEGKERGDNGENKSENEDKDKSEDEGKGADNSNGE